MNCKQINIDSKKELQPYFDLVNYEGCEYCFSTLFMWQHAYKTSYFIEGDFAVIMAEDEGHSFSILPLCKKEDLERVIEFVMKHFEENNEKIYFKGITKDILDIMKEKHNDKFEYIEERDLFDYIYDADVLRELKGKKIRNKRNHINYFLSEYSERFYYKRLEKENFEECIELLKKWSVQKEETVGTDSSMDDELEGINKLFDNYDALKDTLKVGGVYVDDTLEAFTIGEKLNPNMAVIHIEKANSNIRGLYPYINQQFLVNEFSDVEFVNREEDLGIEGLRKAKLSYYPIRFVEKYTIKEK
ncbi:MAG: phosphatidylglycerol lysyltransferase domain-containing protein [Peptostreptococcaceae bacterium]